MRWNRGSAASALLGLLLLSAAAGCSSKQDNTWFFAVARVPRPGVPTDEHLTTQANCESGVHLKFYRVRVKGEALNAEAQLQTGFYPAQALHDLYSEVKATSEPTSHEVVLQCDPLTHQLTAVDPESRFTILYGTKTDALTQQIHTFATTQETAEKLKQLLDAASGAGQSGAKADAAEKKTNATTQSAGELATELRKIAADLATTKPDGVSSRLGDAAQVAAAKLGSSTKFPTTQPSWSDEAQKTYDALKK
jgi:hypothetical protein